MRWHARPKDQASDLEGKELAKRQRDRHDLQREVADAIVESSSELAHESRWRLFNNHFAESFILAMEGRRDDR